MAAVEIVSKAVTEFIAAQNRLKIVKQLPYKHRVIFLIGASVSTIAFAIIIAGAFFDHRLILFGGFIFIAGIVVIGLFFNQTLTEEKKAINSVTGTMPSEDGRSPVVEQIAVKANFRAELEWEKLFEGASSLTLFVSWGNTWRTSNLHHLQAMISSDDKTVTVFLPNPSDANTLSELSRRYNLKKAEISSKISQSIKSYEDLFQDKKDQLWIVDAPPLLSFYLFERKSGNVCVIAPYSLESCESGANPPIVPKMIVNKDSALYHFIESQIEFLKKKTSKSKRRK